MFITFVGTHLVRQLFVEIRRSLDYDQDHSAILNNNSSYFHLPNDSLIQLTFDQVSPTPKNFYIGNQTTSFYGFILFFILLSFNLLIVTFMLFRKKFTKHDKLKHIKQKNTQSSPFQTYIKISTKKMLHLKLISKPNRENKI